MLLTHNNMIKNGIMSFRPTKSFFRSYHINHIVGVKLNSATKVLNHNRRACLIDRYSSNSISPLIFGSEIRSIRLSQKSWLTRCYSSESNENKAGENVIPLTKDLPNSDEHKKNTNDGNIQGDPQARLDEQDRMEGFEPEKPLLENEKKKSPLLTRGAKFKDEFLGRIVPWQEINDSWDTFPYYIHERDKNLLKECMASRLKYKKHTKDYSGRLATSSGRILLQSLPGTGLYRDTLVRTLAKELQVQLMVLDSRVLPPYEASQIEPNEESDDEDDCDDEDENDSDGEDDSDDEDDTQTSSGTCKECASGESESSEKGVCQLMQGDRVKYVGPSTSMNVDNRTLTEGQRGEVLEVKGDKVGVVFCLSGLRSKKSGMHNKSTENAEPPVLWLDAKNVEYDNDAQTHDCYVAIEVLCEILESQQPIIVYFPDSFRLLSRETSWKIREEFFSKVKEMFEQLSGPMVLICGQNKWGDGWKHAKKLLDEIMIEPEETDYYEKMETGKLFVNLVYIKPPKEEDLLKTFCKQIKEDWTTVTYRSNLREMHEVLKEHNILCTDLERVKTDGLTLTKRKAEKIIGWATNHYLSTSNFLSLKEDRSNVPQASLELAIMRLKEQETESTKKPSLSQSSKCPKDLATCEYEKSFISALIHPSEISVKFDDVGALEEVKKALNELVILPMKRPDLFTHGNLLRPCKGMLLFGPPGTGKTLIAKALAKEAGANFISVTPSSLTSKWYGDEEKLTRALFSFAGKLAPVIIFVDEVDALLGARGGHSEHEATRKGRNEFMAAWDGLQSKDGERILVLGATNRPFDLDDAVIRRMPRRILVDLPDVRNRLKILKILLAKEDLESGFDFGQLAKDTEGYSGSDLKNLCVAAAYIPVQEILDQESKGDSKVGDPALRPLKFDDFIHSKTKVGPSVSYDSISLTQLR